MRKPLPKLEEMTDILDLKDMVVWDLGWVFILLMAVLGAVVIWLAWHLIKKRRETGVTLESEKTPIETALMRLNNLVEGGLVESGRVRVFYFGLSEIFRQFLEEELQVPAAEATLEEMKIILRDISEFTQDEIKDAVWFLELCDMAKFAKFIPEKDEIIKSVRVARVLMMDLARRREAVREAAQEAPSDENVHTSAF